MKLIIKVIFKAIIGLINIVLTPLDLLVSNVFPDLAYALGKVSGFFEWVLTFIRYVLSWLPFDSSFYVFLTAALIFYYSVPIMVRYIKLAINWYIALKP